MNILRLVMPFSGLIIIAVMSTIMNRQRYGRYIPGKYAVKFLNEWLSKYTYDPFLEDLDPPMDFKDVTTPPFISKTFGCIFSKWRIRGYGRILRYSKAHRMIEERIAREKNQARHWL